MKKSGFLSFFMMMIIPLLALFPNSGGQDPGLDDIGDPDITIEFGDTEISTTSEIGITERVVYYNGYIQCLFPDSAPPYYECTVSLFVDSPDIIASDIPDMIFTKTATQYPIRIEVEIDKVYPAYDEYRISVSGKWWYEHNLDGGEIEEVVCWLKILPFSRVYLETPPNFASKDYEVGKWYDFNIGLRNLGNVDDLIRISIESDTHDVDFRLNDNSTFLERGTECTINGQFKFNSESNDWTVARIIARGSHNGISSEDGELLYVKIEQSAINESAVKYLPMYIIFVLIFFTSLVVGIIIIRKRIMKSNG